MRSRFYCRIVLLHCVLSGGLSSEFNHVIYCNDDDDDVMMIIMTIMIMGMILMLIIESVACLPTERVGVLN